MLPLIPLGIAALGGTAWWVNKKKKEHYGELTPERAIIYKTALEVEKDPAKLRILAQSFRDGGLAPQADLLEKRAALRTLPVDTKAIRRDIFKQGMASTNPVAIEQLAASFEGEGATGAADALRRYARGLVKKHEDVMHPGKTSTVGSEFGAETSIIGAEPSSSSGPSLLTCIAFAGVVGAGAYYVGNREGYVEGWYRYRNGQPGNKFGFNLERGGRE